MICTVLRSNKKSHRQYPDTLISKKQNHQTTVAADNINNHWLGAKNNALETLFWSSLLFETKKGAKKDVYLDRKAWH